MRTRRGHYRTGGARGGASGTRGADGRGDGGGLVVYDTCTGLIRSGRETHPFVSIIAVTGSRVAVRASALEIDERGSIIAASLPHHSHF